MADIYLVSRYDRKLVARPYIFVAVDVASQLITGVHVGFECNENATLACLYSCVRDKVALCAEYGIEIAPEDWPGAGLPSELVTDKGREFLGGRLDELVLSYGMDTHSLPSFRPDEKGLVEKTMDLIQKRYKYLLRGKGVIEPDARERWAVDYRDQALLDLDEFTAIVLRIIVSLNKSRILENFQPPKEMAKTLSSFTPAHIWHWLEEHGKSTMLNVSEEKFYHYSLPRTTVRVSQRGILFQGLTYNTREVLLTVGKTVEIAYDENDTSCVFLVKKAGGEALFLPIPLAPAMEQYRSVSFMEYTQVRKNLSKQKAKGKQQETQERVSAMADIKNIISNRKGESK